MDDKKPYVWQMVKDAVDNLHNQASYTDIKEYIKGRWGKVNSLTITDQIQVLTVNHNSRINYPQNNKPRLTNSNSLYDCLFTTGRGQVVKYNPNEHGVWEIYKDKSNKLGVRQFSEGFIAKIYTPNDIVWFKNVTNSTNGEAYLDTTENPFVIHFPNKHKTNVLTPAIDELILVYQKVKGVPAFTHIVTPVDYELIENNQRADFRYGRRVKVIAKTNSQNIIKVSSTLWHRLKFGGIIQGNACRLENISNIGNIDELQFDIWERFKEHFVPTEQQSATTTSALISELENFNPDLTVKEGELKLVSHLVKERNRKIVTAKKLQAIRNNSLKCEVCTFSFPDTYNADFIECHHLSPISQPGVRETRLEDLALVCANCHRMLHTRFGGQYLTIKQLQERIKSLN